MPYVGPLVTLVLAGIVGLTVLARNGLVGDRHRNGHPVSFENTIVVPRVMDKAVGVSPVVTLLALAVFSDLFGLLGALLAVPLAAVVRVLLDHAMRRASVPAEQNIGGRETGWRCCAPNSEYRQQSAHAVPQKTPTKPTPEEDIIEEELEALLVDLDNILASAQEQRA